MHRIKTISIQLKLKTSVLWLEDRVCFVARLCKHRVRMDKNFKILIPGKKKTCLCIPFCAICKLSIKPVVCTLYYGISAKNKTLKDIPVFPFLLISERHDVCLSLRWTKRVGRRVWTLDDSQLHPHCSTKTTSSWLKKKILFGKKHWPSVVRESECYRACLINQWISTFIAFAEYVLRYDLSMIFYFSYKVYFQWVFKWACVCVSVTHNVLPLRTLLICY